MHISWLFVVALKNALYCLPTGQIVMHKHGNNFHHFIVCLQRWKKAKKKLSCNSVKHPGLKTLWTLICKSLLKGSCWHYYQNLYDIIFKAKQREVFSENCESLTGAAWPLPTLHDQLSCSHEPITSTLKCWKQGSMQFVLAETLKAECICVHKSI